MAKKIVRSSKEKEEKVVNEKDLMAVAKGVKPPSVVTEKFWTKEPPYKMDRIFYRRQARRAIYAILKHWKFGWDFSDKPELIEMRDMITAQLDPNRQVRWDDFTHKWDLHPNDVTRIVFKEHWAKEGGGYDLDTGMPYPTAFTEQEHD